MCSVVWEVCVSGHWNERQAASVAKMVLNQNSVRMLHKTSWTSPSQRRKKAQCKYTPGKKDKHVTTYYFDGNPCDLETGDISSEEQ